MDNQQLYACPCCGYKTLNAKPPATYLVCPICFWEDNGDKINNRVSLRQAQRNFIALGACESEWLDYVRSPTAEDVRDSSWQTIDAVEEKIRLALIGEITTAFEQVKREEGITLHEARALDDYENTHAARKIDSDRQWQDVPDEWIEYFYDVFAFFDAKGFRYYLPAYMIWCLKNYKTSNSNTVGFTTMVLKSRNSSYRSRFELFNKTQLQVSEAFLNFMETYYM